MEIYFLFLLIFLMAGALASGFPVAFALPGSAIITVGLAALAGYIFTGDVDSYFADGGPHVWLSAGVTNFRGVYWEAERDTLIAIPLFIFMGIMLQRSRIAEDLLVTMAQLFGPMPGGLGISVILVGALLAATTGIVGATVVAMGLISLPAMLRNGYSHSLATGTISASGTLGQIIPPSIVLIILADQLSSATDQASTTRKALYKTNTGEFSMPSAYDVSSTSAGEMFLGALFPGLVLVGLYVLFVAVYALLRPKVAPPVPYEGKYDFKFAGQVLMALVPPLALIFAVLGSIIFGIATVNQAGSIGAAGALIMAGYRLYNGHSNTYLPAILAFISVVMIIFITQVAPINIKNIQTDNDLMWLVIALVAVSGLIISLIWSGWRVLNAENTLHSVMLETAKTTALVFIILLGAAMLTSAFRGFGGEELVKEFLHGIPGGFWGQFLIVMLVIFVLGFFLDFIEIAVVVVPIIAPILLADPSANVTAVWLGVMIGLNIQTSFLTPPFGFALFYLRGVAPKVVKTISMYKGVIAFICLQLIALVIVAYNPLLVNYLPQRVSLTSETSPPPINPKLQHCIERRLFKEYDEKGATIREAISKAKKIDLSLLPTGLRSDIQGSFKNAENTFVMVNNIQNLEREIKKRAISYRPMHVKVRELQKEIRDLNEKIKPLKDDLDRDGANKNKLSSQIKELENQIKDITAKIPNTWKKQNGEFSKLLKQEKIARLKYRRNVDEAYSPIIETIKTIESAEQLSLLKDNIDRLENYIKEKPHKESADDIAETMTLIAQVEGASKIRSALYKVRKALRGRKVDPEKAIELLNSAKKIYQQDVTWRRAAATQTLPQLKAYDKAIKHTIGLRQLPKIPKNIALGITSCTSEHRDLTLYF